MKRQIFCFWVSDNEMSMARVANLQHLRDHSGCQVELITLENLEDFVSPEYLHPAFEHLSDVHKSDFLRCLFMYRLGGGYSDIKRCGGDWTPAFDELAANPDLEMVGHPETRAGQVANIYASSCQMGEPFRTRASAYIQRKWLQFNLKQLVGQSSFVCRAGAPIITDWWTELNRRLTRLQPLLELHPAQHPRDAAGRMTGDQVSRYPIPWEYLNGDIMHPLCMRHRVHISNKLVTPDFKEYL